MNFDILIIGNGILGLSTAFALSLEDPSLKIGLLGPNNKNGSASIAAGAMLGCFGEVTASSLKSDYGQEKLSLAIKAAEMWPKWTSQINSHLNNETQITLKEGTFIILNANSGPLDDKNYQAILQALRIHNEPHEEVNPRDIPGMNPVENCRPLRALFIPNERFVKTEKLIDGLHKRIEATKNVIIIDDVAQTITTSLSKICTINTKSGAAITAERFLIAAGAYSQFLLDQIPPLHFRIPRILFGAGNSLILRHPEFHGFEHVVRSPNRAGACGAHIVPYDKNTIYMGASNSIRPEEQNYPRAQDIHYLIQRGIEQFSQALHKFEIIKHQTGNRPVTIDSYPLVGRTPIDNLWLLTGTYRDGIHDSPLLAQLIAKEMLGKPINMVNKFIPARKPISAHSQEESINEFVEQCVSAAHEHSIRLPNLGWSGHFNDLWRKRGEFLYSELGIDNDIFIDLLIMLEQEPKYIPEIRNYYKEINNSVFGSSIHILKKYSKN